MGEIMIFINNIQITHQSEAFEGLPISSSEVRGQRHFEKQETEQPLVILSLRAKREADEVFVNRQIRAKRQA